MTKREIFDHVKEHLLTQNAKSAEEDGSCRYRGPFNRMCAIGCLIPENLYSETMEGCSVSGLFQDSPELRHILLSGDHMAMLVGLQRIHDDGNVDDWPRELAIIEEEEFK